MSSEHLTTEHHSVFPSIMNRHLHTAPSTALRWPLAGATGRTACCLAVVALLAACSGGDAPPSAGKDAPASTAASGAAARDQSVITVKPEMADRFKAEPVELRAVSSLQEVAGRIEANEQKVTRIGAAVTGRVTDILVDVGANVSRGQPLAQVSSPELTQAQLAFLRANANREMAERAEDRAQQLIRADVIGNAELLRRRTELSIANAELRSATDQLQMLGISADAVSRLRQQGTLAPTAAVSSPLAGTVIERQVSQGQVAQPGDPLFTVADLSRVWVVGSLPEQTARSVQVGQSVEVQVPALAMKQWSGRIIFVGDTVNPETRTVTIRTEVENAGRALKPQMLATLRLAGAPVQLPTVPVAAVVREKDRDHVYVRTAENTYRFTPVELGPADPQGQRPVIKGVSAGTPVVVDGAFHLHNERKRAELE